MFALMMDQIASSGRTDLVPALLDDLASVEVVLPFARTAGDEIQGLTITSQAALEAMLIAVDQRNWYIGVGVGDVETPLPITTNQARGSAYKLARAALNQAKRESGRGGTPPVAVKVADPAASQHATAAVRLLANLHLSRTPAGAEACALMSVPGMTGRKAAAQLGISPQALSERLKAAHWALDKPAVQLALQTMSEAASNLDT